MMQQKLPVRFLIVFLIVVLAACAVLIAYRSPLAPSLTGVQPPAASPTPAAARVTATSTINRPSASPTTGQPTARPSKTPEGLCGLNAPVTILFTGTGLAQGMTTADAIRVIRVDPAERTVTILAFPRDLHVRTNVLQSANMPEGRLGPAYYYKKQITPGTERQQTVAATTVLAQVLYDNFGVTPDHYITVNLAEWGQMIDAVDGVEVTLEAPVELANGVILQAGTHRLDGQQAVEFVRYTNGGGEQERLARQNKIARALHARLIRGDTLLNADAIIEGFREAIVTDLSAQQLVALFCLVREIPEDGVTFAEVDESMVSEGADGALIPNVDAVRALVEQTFNP